MPRIILDRVGDTDTATVFTSIKRALNLHEAPEQQLDSTQDYVGRI
jgi:hypothetical protein